MQRTFLLALLALSACGPNNPPEEPVANPPPTMERRGVPVSGPALVDAEAGALGSSVERSGRAEVLWIRELTLGTRHEIAGLAVNRLNSTLVLEYVYEPHPDGPDYFPLRTGVLRQFDRAGREAHSLTSTNRTPDSDSPRSTVMPVGDGFAVIGDYEFLQDSFYRPTFQCPEGAVPSLVLDERLQCARALPPRVSGRIASVIIGDEGTVWLAYTVQGRAGMLAPLEKYAPTGELLLRGSELFPKFFPLHQHAGRLVATSGTSVGELDEDFNVLWERNVGVGFKNLIGFAKGGFGAVISMATTERWLDGNTLPAGREGLAQIDGSGFVRSVVPLEEYTGYPPLIDAFGLAVAKPRSVVTYSWDGARSERVVLSDVTGPSTVARLALAGERELRAIVGLLPGASVVIGTERFVATDTARTFLVALRR